MMNDDSRAVFARLGAMNALENMGVLNTDEARAGRRGPHLNYTPLKRLLGYSTDMHDHVFCISMTITDVETLELLAGPHGYAIYKMLEVRKRCWNEE